MPIPKLIPDRPQIFPGLPPRVNFPPMLPSFHAKMPVGTDFVPVLVSVTFPLKVIELPIITDDGFGNIVVEVLRNVIVTKDFPELVL